MRIASAVEIDVGGESGMLYMVTGSVVYRGSVMPVSSGLGADGIAEVPHATIAISSPRATTANTIGSLAFNSPT
jgi:hypothetical protein